MPAFFQEVFTSAGVDEDAKPAPGMIVSAGGSNITRLAGGKGLRLQAPRTLNIEELSPIPSVIAIALLSPSNLAGLLKPGALADARYFRISGKAPIGPRIAQVKAVAVGKSRPEAVLDVAVLKQRKVKLSIRPVQVRSAQGGVVFHSKKPFDTKAMVEEMNSIWTPQANVAFELVSSDPAQITDEAEIAKILDLKMSKEAPLPSMVVLQRFSDVFVRFKDKGADLTMFLVESAGDLNDPRVLYSHAKVVNGITDPMLGISLISDARTSLREVMAHEAGHFIGSRTGRDGKLMIFGDRGGTRDLMQGGGSDTARIPFHDAIDFFNRP
jgi:hypothetical protein